MKRTLLAIIMLTLAGCNTEGTTPPYITYHLNKAYDGRPINTFFVDYGYPASLFEQTNGGKVYKWASTQYEIEPRQAAPNSYTSPQGNYQFVDTYHGSTEHQYCEMRIYTDADDTIKDFSVAVDTTGKWSKSRCSEIFNNYFSY